MEPSKFFSKSTLRVKYIKYGLRKIQFTTSRVSRLSLFSRYHLAGLTWGARRVKKRVAKIFSIFVDGNIGISALEFAKNRTIMKISSLSYFDDIILYECGLKSRA